MNQTFLWQNGDLFANMERYTLCSIDVLYRRAVIAIFFAVACLFISQFFCCYPLCIYALCIKYHRHIPNIEQLLHTFYFNGHNQILLTKLNVHCIHTIHSKSLFFRTYFFFVHILAKSSISIFNLVRIRYKYVWAFVICYPFWKR